MHLTSVKFIVTQYVQVQAPAPEPRLAQPPAAAVRALKRRAVVNYVLPRVTLRPVWQIVLPAFAPEQVLEPERAPVQALEQLLAPRPVQPLVTDFVLLVRAFQEVFLSTVIRAKSWNATKSQPVHRTAIAADVLRERVLAQPAPARARQQEHQPEPQALPPEQLLAVERVRHMKIADGCVNPASLCRMELLSNVARGTAVLKACAALRVCIAVKKCEAAVERARVLAQAQALQAPEPEPAPVLGRQVQAQAAAAATAREPRARLNPSVGAYFILGTPVLMEFAGLCHLNRLIARIPAALELQREQAREEHRPRVQAQALRQEPARAVREPVLGEIVRMWGKIAATAHVFLPRPAASSMRLFAATG